MSELALVCFGSRLGGVLRAGVGMGAVRIGVMSTWGTLVVNVVGTFIAVLVAQWLASHVDHPRIPAPAKPGRLSGGMALAEPTASHPGAQQVSAFISVGILGGFTTYSAFQVQVFAAVARGAWGAAGLIFVTTVLGCLVAGGMAMAIARS